MVHDSPVYPIGVEEVQSGQAATTRIRKVLITLILQTHHHFIHKLTNLREEYIYSIESRSINLNIKFLAGAQKRCFAREDEIETTFQKDGQRNMAYERSFHHV
jgi:hypothetical protein